MTKSPETPSPARLGVARRIGCWVLTSLASSLLLAFSLTTAPFAIASSSAHAASVARSIARLATVHDVAATVIGEQQLNNASQDSTSGNSGSTNNGNTNKVVLTDADRAAVLAVLDAHLPDVFADITSAVMTAARHHRGVVQLDLNAILMPSYNALLALHPGLPPPKQQVLVKSMNVKPVTRAITVVELVHWLSLVVGLVALIGAMLLSGIRRPATWRRAGIKLLVVAAISTAFVFAVKISAHSYMSHVKDERIRKLKIGPVANVILSPMWLIIIVFAAVGLALTVAGIVIRNSANDGTAATAAPDDHPVDTVDIVTTSDPVTLPPPPPGSEPL